MTKKIEKLADLPKNELDMVSKKLAEVLGDTETKIREAIGDLPLGLVGATLGNMYAAIIRVSVENAIKQSGNAEEKERWSQRLIGCTDAGKTMEEFAREEQDRMMRSVISMAISETKPEIMQRILKDRQEENTNVDGDRVADKTEVAPAQTGAAEPNGEKADGKKAGSTKAKRKA